MNKDEFKSKVTTALNKIAELDAINFEIKENYSENHPLYVSLYAYNYGKDIQIDAFLNENDNLEAEFGEHIQEVSTEYEIFVFFADQLNQKRRKADKALEDLAYMIKNGKFNSNDAMEIINEALEVRK